MHIEFTEEQIMLRDMADKYLRDNYSFDGRQEIVKSEQGFNREHWATFAELGLLGMTFSEEVGGFGGGALETMLLCEQFGKHLVLEPYLETVVLTGGLLVLGAKPEIRDAYLEKIISGELQGAVAYLEPNHVCDPQYVEATGTNLGGEYLLNGTKTMVFNGPEADILLVSVRTGGTTNNSRYGITSFIIERDTPGMTLHNYKTYDGRTACDITLDNVRVSADRIIGTEGTSYKMSQPVLLRALIAVCSEAIGAMDALMHATIEYTKQRKQFGQPISNFQALRHRMADMFMQIELTRSLLLASAWKLDNGSSDALQCLTALKAKVGKAGRYVAHNAIQLHGGIGTTDELNVGHYFKRLAAIDMLFGSRDIYLSRYFKP